MEPDRRLSAIVFTDIVGYTTMIQESEEKAIATVRRFQTVLESMVPKYRGEVLQYYGDGSLSVFKTATDAMKCCLALQLELQQEPVVPLRVGVHIGEVLISGDKIFGGGVNLASRIESLGQPGSVLFSRRIYDEIRNNSEFQMNSLGMFDFKNVDVATEVFALTNDGLHIPERKSLSGKLKEKSKSSLISASPILIIVLAVLVLGSLGYFAIKGLTKPDLSTDVEKSIAVLPFKNLSNDETQDYFSDGITEDILTQLSKISDLRVVSGASSMRYKDSELSLPQIARKVKVKHLLHGSIRKADQQVRISVRLVNAENEDQIWAEDFDKDITDVFTVQKDVAVEVARRLRAELTNAERERVQKIVNVNPLAYENYQKGQEIMRKGSLLMEDLKQAETFYHNAIQLDPNFSHAHIALANAYLEYNYWGRMTVQEAIPLAMESALKAMEIDNEVAECHQILGAIAFYNLDLVSAEKQCLTAIELNANYAPSYDLLGWIYTFNDDFDKAKVYFQKAIELDPLSAKYHGNFAQCYYNAHRFDEGIEFMTPALDEFELDNWMLWTYANLYQGKNNHRRAIEIFRSRTAGTETNWSLGYSYAKIGELDKARGILQYLLDARKQRFVPPIMIAALYSGLGETDKALDWLETEYQDGGVVVLFYAIHQDPKFESLWDHPRFKELLRKTGFN